MFLMAVAIKGTPGQYLNLGQILSTKKLISMYLTCVMIKAKKNRERTGTAAI